ncbi:DNA-binding protein [Bradyrhizobium sp. 31Argb]|uniref:helix-turn-helix transcriptional regulator n=1 Tax=Bradyrhizobium sp. 31Argb TaxID=3141247 RepID=UPI00374A44F0
MSTPLYLTLEEVILRYRNQVSEGTLRNWRSYRIGPSFIKIGKAILYPVEELDRWDRSNLVSCKRTRSYPLEATDIGIAKTYSLPDLHGRFL